MIFFTNKKEKNKKFIKFAKIILNSLKYWNILSLFEKIKKLKKTRPPLK